MSSTLVEFSNTLADAVEQAGAFVVGVPEGGQQGVSGVVWKEGVAVTADHTIRGREQVTLVLPSGENTTAQVAGRDPGTDLAVLKFNTKTKFARLADETRARVGEVVLSVARRNDDGLAVTHGVLSAISGPWRTWQGARVDRWFRLDLDPFPGFSGGAVVNARGEVLGVANSGPRRTVMTIPSSTVSRVVEHLLNGGRVTRGYFGIGVQPVVFSDATRQSLSTSHEGGLLIATLASDSPAEKSGLMLGDILVTVQKTAARSLRNLQAALDPENVGKSVPVELVRGGKLMSLSVTVGERHGR